MHGWEVVPGTWIMKLRVVAFAIPLGTGAALFVVLLKPFLARPVDDYDPLELEPEDEPLLYDFVDRLAEEFGAPEPSRILVDNQVNASAGFRNGFRGWITGDLELTLGMPLVAGLSAPQCAAVIAHELGHFAQGSGMRSSYAILRTQRWFSRVVYKRDSFDRGLDRFAKGSGNHGTWVVLNTARAGIWLSRKLLLGLMHLSELVVQGLSRQMEFDADAQAVRALGAKAFGQFMLELPLIDASSDKTEQLAQVGFREGRLPLDWSSATMLLRKGMSDDEMRKRRQRALQQQPHMYASHPPTGDRIERAKAAGHEPAHALAGRATLFFEDFAALSREVTEDMYARGSAGARQDMQYVSAQEFCGQFGAEQALRDEGVRDLGSAWFAPLLLRLDPGAAPVFDGGEAELRVRGGLEAAARAASERDALQRLRRTGLVLRSLGVKVSDGDFRLKGASASPGFEMRLEECEALLAELQPHAAAMSARLYGARDALGRGGLELSREERETLTSKLEAGLAALEACGPLGPTLFELSRSGKVLKAALGALEEAPSDRVEQRLRRELSKLYARLEEQLAGVAYPFSEGVGLAEHLALGAPQSSWTPAQLVGWSQPIAHEG